MRKFLSVCCVAVMTCSLWAAVTYQSALFPSAHSRAMGGVELAFSNDPLSIYRNPAQLAFMKDFTFTIAGIYEDTYVPDFFQDGDVHLIYEPTGASNFSFFTEHLALSVCFQNQLTEQNGTYSITKISNLHMALAYRFDSFGLGLSVAGGTSRIRNFTLPGNLTLIDYLTHSLFASYEQITDGTHFSIGMGITFAQDWFRAAVSLESLVVLRETTVMVFDLKELFSSLSFGIGFETPQYSRDNRLQLFSFLGGIDIQYLGDDAAREVRFGFEAEMHVLPEYSVSFLLGYRERKPNFENFFTPQAEEGIQTLGVGVKLNKVYLTISIEMPVEWYLGNIGNDNGLGVILGISTRI